MKPLYQNASIFLFIAVIMLGFLWKEELMVNKKLTKQIELRDSINKINTARFDSAVKANNYYSQVFKSKK